MGVPIGVSQSYRAVMANMCACRVLPTPKSLAPLELRDGRPLGCLRTIAFPLRSPHHSPKMARRVLTLTGVPALKDAPRSTSTSALHRHRPACDHDAGHGRAAAPRTSEALGVRQKAQAREPSEILKNFYAWNFYLRITHREALKNIYAALLLTWTSAKKEEVYTFT